MGRVLAARDLTFDREVAIKLLLPSLTKERGVKRFIRESKITACLPHPGIPPVYTMGSLADGNPFLVMKLIRGRTLADLLRERSSLTEELPHLLRVVEQICQAVGYAHSVGIIHRDLKPSNVMVGPFEEVLVMDWGLAKQLGDSGGPGNKGVDDVLERIDTESPEWEETRPGTIAGTVSFMAPEQARGEIENLDARADVFAIGAILYQILVGEPPYGVHSPRTILHRAATGFLFEAFARVSDCGADEGLTAICCRCLDPKREARFANAREVAEALRASREHTEIIERESNMARAAHLGRYVVRRARFRRTFSVLSIVLLLIPMGLFGLAYLVGALILKKFGPIGEVVMTGAGAVIVVALAISFLAYLVIYESGYYPRR